MTDRKHVLITGAAGNLGSKLRAHLANHYQLTLLDIDPKGDASVHRADLRQWNASWSDLFAGVDVVVHLAANAVAHGSWPDVIKANVDGVIHVYEAAVRARVQRVVFASSNHVMGGYKNLGHSPLSPDTSPRPGTRYEVAGELRDSTPYGASKLFGERVGKCYAEIHGLSVIAVRIGWVRPGENRPEDVPPERGPWFRAMWLSNRDFCRLMECCITANPGLKFAIVNGMSANTGMRWDIGPTRELLGYEPLDDVTRVWRADAAGQ